MYNQFRLISNYFLVFLFDKQLLSSKKDRLWYFFGEEEYEEPLYLGYFTLSFIGIKLVLKPLDFIKMDFDEIYLSDKGKKYQIPDLNFLEILLAEILVVPVQTLVSSFIVEVQ